LTAGALEEAFQAGLEAGRAFRGGLEINLTQEAPAPIAGGAVAPLEAGKRRSSKKRSAKRSAKKRSAKRSAKKSHKRSHKKGRKSSRRA
jgi:hypothetical protein